MSKQSVLIKRAFNEQYILLIEMEAKMVSAFFKSRTRAKYDFTILNVCDDYFECRLLQLELTILDSNADLIREIAEVTEAFNTMFNELHLIINHKGEIIEVLNVDLILFKWKETKANMEQAILQNDQLKALISTNDNLFASPSKIKDAIKANEFLQTYFSNIFGSPLPTRKIISGTNIMNTVFMDWVCNIDEPLESENGKTNSTKRVKSTSIPADSLSSKFKKEAYNQFAESLDIEKLTPELNQSSEHIIENDSGKLIQSLIKKSETVEKELYIKINYRIVNEAIFLRNPERLS